MLNFTKKRVVSLVLVAAMLLGAIPADTFRLFSWAVTGSGSDTTAQESVTELGEFTNPFTPETQITLPDKTVTTSQSYRIPAMVTLNDGTIVAAADIRWNTTYDGGGLDTLVARSTDGGATWSYTLANYLDDNATGTDRNVYNPNHTTFIDPSLVVAEDGQTVYMLVDLYAYGVALNGKWNGNYQLFAYPETDTGFNADGYLKLSSNNHASFGYYLKEGKIYSDAGVEQVGYTVDAYFNITYKEGNVEKKSNLFYSDSPFKVARTQFLYLTKSTDGGETWSEPTLLDVRAKSKVASTENALLVAPGNALTTSDGVMVFPAYSYTSSQQFVTLIYSVVDEDGNVTWARSESYTGLGFSSEGSIVELEKGKLRVFVRNKTGHLCYVDFDMETGTWIGHGDTKVPTNSNTQLSAITYSKTMNGQQVILVSCPTGHTNLADGTDNNDGSMRTNGKIHVFVVDSEGNMTLKNSVKVNEYTATAQLSGSNYEEHQGFFAYSSMTERSDGSIALLYENNQFGWGAGDKTYYTIAGKCFDQFALVGGMFAGEGEREKVILKSDISQVTLYSDPASSMSDNVTIDASRLDGVYYISDAYYDVATKTLLYKLELCVGMSWPGEYEDYRYIPASMVEQTDQGIATPIVDFTNPAPIANSAAVTPAVTPYARRSLFASPAQTAYAMTRAGANDALVMSKVVKDNKDGTYTITLEAYTTGTVKVTQVSQPMDIVLVLDQSLSMRYCIYCGKDLQNNSSGTCSEAPGDYSAVATPSNGGSGDYYIKDGDTYKQVYYCSGRVNRRDVHTAGWFDEEHSANSSSSSSHGGQTVDVTGQQLYQKGGAHERRDVALRAAVQAFVDSVYEKSDVAHRIAIVGFAAESATYGAQSSGTAIMTSGYGNNQVVEYNNCNDPTQASHLNVLKNSLQFTNDPDGKELINNAIDQLAPVGGSTRSDLGMKLATAIYEANADSAENRSRVTIMFTDGTPSNGSTSFNQTVADNAIKEAKTQKDAGVTVYTVGIFDGADASNPTSLPGTSGSPARENRYMHLVSSNYPEAADMDHPGDINDNDDVKNGTKSYYLSASSTEALNAIFVAMGENVQGSTPITLDAETVVKDIITPQFTLPEGVSNVTVKQVDCETYNSSTGEATWGAETVLDSERTVTINSADHSVDVTGFDFTHNYVAQEARVEDGSDGERDFRGRKLVIVFTIQPDPRFLGGDRVKTNDEKSGIYSKGELVKAFTPGSADVPLKEIRTELTPKHIYYGNTVDLTGILDLLVDLEGEEQDIRIDVDGIFNAYVDLLYTIKLNDSTIATYFVPAGEVWGSDECIWSDTTSASAAELLQNYQALTDTSFEVTCTMTSINLRTNVKETAPNSEWVYVYKPTVTFKDSVQEYNKTLNMGTDVTSFLDAHFVNTVWKHGDTLSTAVTMEGTAPNITFSYGDAMTSGAFTGHVMNSTTDVPVDVTATINGTGDAMTSGVTFVHQTCTHPGCGYASGNAEFIVHVINALTSLTIQKEGWNSSDPNQTFLFTVTGKDANGADIELTVTVHQNGSVTIDGLIVGNEYTIVEKTDWSWRYDYDGVVTTDGKTTVTVTGTVASGAKAILKDTGNKITFSNDRDENKWLDGDSWCNNLFK